MILEKIVSWLNENGYNFSFAGDKQTEVLGFASLQSCRKKDITWIKNKENYEKCGDKSQIKIAVVQKGLNLDVPNQIVSDRSKEVFFEILHHFWGSSYKNSYIGEGTYISEDAEIDSTVYIGRNCSISGNVKIADNTVIEDNVTIKNATIGSGCLIHSGAVIGEDGFGFSFNEEGIPVKIEHFGGVRIGNNVEIGANACIDRGTIDNTVINDDVKIDNLVHIAHNVILNKGAVVVAGAIICGSTEIGKNSYVAPGGIIKNQLQVGDNAFIGMGAVVTKSIDENNLVAGVPAKTIRKVEIGDK